jgi:predicted enzyme related to lactoylglutathione lyase
MRSIKSLAFIAYPVSDIKKSTAWYRDVMGFAPGAMASEHWVEFETGGVTFGIGRGEDLDLKPGSACSVAFEMSDLDGAVAALKAKGVEMTKVMDMSSCRACFVKDPDGNRIALHQRKA